MTKKPIEIFGQELLTALGDGPREPYYHTGGNKPPDGECRDYGFMCYPATADGKPTAPLEIEITIDEFMKDQSILDDLSSDDRKIFIIERKYLWVINADYELHILPERTQNPYSDRGYVCHTNITAGSPARHGGELWYGKDSIVFINNNSGRFYTKSTDEWSAIVKIFITAGYKKVIDIDLRKNSQPKIHE